MLLALPRLALQRSRLLRELVWLWSLRLGMAFGLAFRLALPERAYRAVAVPHAAPGLELEWTSGLLPPVRE